MAPRTTRYVALLRGVNVGGQSLIGKAALVACFEGLGLVEVSTYIQSGNVLFSSSEQAAALGPRIEAALSEALRRPARVALRTHAQLRRIVEAAPAGFGERPAVRRYDVLFLMPPLTPAAALAAAPVRAGVDEVAAGPGVLFYSRLAAKASQSRMSRIVSLPMYQDMTIRNWNTTTKLLALLEG